MRDQRLQIYQAFRHQRDRLWICLVVPELEPDVDLSERSVHERDLLELLSHANDENTAAKTRGLYSVSATPISVAFYRFDSHK
jgi:hypothetical protein